MPATKTALVLHRIWAVSIYHVPRLPPAARLTCGRSDHYKVVLSCLFPPFPDSFYCSPFLAARRRLVMHAYFYAVRLKER